MRRAGAILLVGLFGIGGVGLVLAAELHHAGHVHVQMPIWSVTPFALLLLSIAVMPLIAGHWWHSNRNKAIIVAIFGTIAGGYLLYQDKATHGETVTRLMHAGGEYGSFILLLSALYTISGGIMLTGDLRGRPITNTAFLALGACLANLIGTTGASMILIRPVLRINSERQRFRHIPIFFIFIVSNTGGLLTPLGDPPLFLGFLRGVDFLWTMRLWREWMIVNGSVLVIFFLWDTVAYLREPKRALELDAAEAEPLRLRGLWPNLPLLLGVLLVVLFQSPSLGETLGNQLRKVIAGAPDLVLHKPYAEGSLVLLTVLSLLFTRQTWRDLNRFNWGPIVEVAVLFAGIFVTMVPALMLLEERGKELGVSEPWQYFWLTGGLSSFLDNAPTYLTFATLAAGGGDLSRLAVEKPILLQAISCGAVFMGANTYIGNGPNFMVKAIADEAGFKTPSFFGYMVYSGLILIPIFGLVTWMSFRP